MAALTEELNHPEVEHRLESIERLSGEIYVSDEAKAALKEAFES